MSLKKNQQEFIRQYITQKGNVNAVLIFMNSADFDLYESVKDTDEFRRAKKIVKRHLKDDIMSAYREKITSGTMSSDIVFKEFSRFCNMFIEDNDEGDLLDDDEATEMVIRRADVKDSRD